MLNKLNNYQSPSSVTTMLQQLNWPTLEDRRKAADQILMYKVVNSLVAVPQSYLPQRSPLYVDSILFITYHCRLNIYQHLFFPRTVTYWNQLPASITNIQCLDSFKLAVQPTFSAVYIHVELLHNIINSNFKFLKRLGSRKEFTNTLSRCLPSGFRRVTLLKLKLK